MNYYEELGIERDATSAEIHEAYKLAARLLHPDLQRDRRLKELAECQMRRLSDVVETLLKPQERARYDASLASGTVPALPPLIAGIGGSHLWQTAARYWFWILLGSVTMGMGTWYGLAGSAGTARGAAVENAGAAHETIPPRMPDLTRKKALLLEPAGPQPAERPPAPRFPLAEMPDPALIAGLPQPDAVPPASPHPESTTIPPVALPLFHEIDDPSAAGEGEFGFRGRWLLASDAPEGDRGGRYPARYVEFVLREENGRLAGEYRAVYSRLDKAITPEVAFRVRGELPEGSAGSLQWESTAGAKGELDFTLQAPNRLLVKWWTTRFGRQEVLSSGMAALTRLKTQ